MSSRVIDRAAVLVTVLALLGSAAVVGLRVASLLATATAALS